MGAAAILVPHVKKLRQKGHYPFVAIFTWTGQDDRVAIERFRPYIGHELFAEVGIDPDSVQVYYLTGERTTLVIGYTNSAKGLKQFYSSICFGKGIAAKFYHAVEGYEASETVPM